MTHLVRVLDPISASLRPPEEALPRPLAKDTRALFPEAGDMAVASGSVALGDVIACIASALGIEPPRSLVIAGEVTPEGYLRMPPLSDAAIGAMLGAGERILIAASPDAPSRIREARGDRSTPTVSIALTLALALEHALGLGRQLAAGAVGADREELFSRALNNDASALLGWRNTAQAAIGALRRLRAARAETDTSDYHAQFELEVARDIALRHAGETAVIPWPSNERLRTYERALRLDLLAHVVQSAADGDYEQCRAYARQAAIWLAPPGERHPEDARLLGAVGRAWAAAGSTDEALDALATAVATWRALRSHHQASYAISELLRLAAISAPERARFALEHHAPAILADPRLADASAAFVLLAIGRAHVQLQEPEAALEALGDAATPWANAPLHAQQARLRWKARAHLLAGDLPAAAAAREQLAAHGPSENHFLAALDVADTAEDALTALTALCNLPERGIEALRLLERLAPGWSLESVAASTATRTAVAERYRY